MDSTSSVVVAGLCIGAVVVVALLVLIGNVFRVVREYERLVVFRLGRSIGAKGPGLVLLIPFVDEPRKVDLREQVREIGHQVCITKDNAPINIDFLWFYKILDATSSVIQVGSFEQAAQGMATTTLRSVIGGIPLDDVLSQREHINHSQCIAGDRPILVQTSSIGVLAVADAAEQAHAADEARGGTRTAG